MKLKSGAFLAHIILACSAYGQVGFGPLTNPSTAGASSNVSNNFFDGTANIGIPFFTKTFDGINVNVSAFYNTKGIKVDQTASSIGLGWELNTGGFIQRIVKSQADEYFVPEHTDRTEYYDGNSMTVGSVHHDPATGLWHNYSAVPKAHTQEDEELDVFTLYLGDKSVDFTISRYGEVIIQPKTNVKIERILNNSSVVSYIGTPPSTTFMIGFRVTDEFGNIYEFVPGDYEEIIVNHSRRVQSGSSFTDHICNPNSSNIAQPIPINIPIKWVMSHIITSNQYDVFYSYDYRRIENLSLSKVSNSIEYTSGGIPALQAPKEEIKKFNGYLAEIRRIDFQPDFTSVVFTYDNQYNRCDLRGARALKEITISQNNSLNGITNYEKYILNYAYFHSIEGGRNFIEGAFQNPCNSISANGSSYNLDDEEKSRELRLKLLSIDKKGMSGSLKRYFTLSYYDNQFNGYSMNMPARLSYKQDYFGYYNNGAHTYFPGNSNIYNVPRHTHINASTSYYDYGVDKNPNAIYTRAFLLNKIKNGMGGETEFTYSEPTGLGNSLSTPAGMQGVNANDGLIVTSQINRDGFNNSNTSTIEYIYDPNYGYRFLTGGTMSFSIQTNCSTPTTTYIFYNSMLSANLIINGSNHGYSKVREVHKDMVGNTLSSTEYLFSNVVNNPAGYGIPTSTIISNLSDPLGQPSSFAKAYSEAPFTQKKYFRDWLVGLPLRTTFFDHAGNKVKEEVNEYEDLGDYYWPSNLNLSKKKIPSAYDCSGNVTASHEERYYPITGLVRLKKTTNTSFQSASKSLTTISEYGYSTYGTYNYLTSSKTTNLNNGEEVENRMFYPWHWWGTNPMPPAINYMIQNNRSRIILSETWKKTGGVNYLMNLEGHGLELSSTNLVRLKHSYRLLTANGIPSTSYTSGIQGFNMNTASSGGAMVNFQKLGTITEYQTGTLLREIQGLGNQYSVKFYDAYSQKLLAEVDNSRYQDFAYSSFECEYAPKGSADINKGNLDFDFNNIVKCNSPSLSIKEISGSFCYRLSANTVATNVTTTNVLQSGKKYMVSLWAKAGAPVLKWQNGSTISLTLIEFARDGWGHYQVEVVGNGNSIYIQADNTTPYTYIDEIRIHPSVSKMRSYTYLPLFGISSSCNENNRFAYYEYDEFGSQNIVRNQWDEIQVKKEYTQQGND